MVAFRTELEGGSGNTVGIVVPESVMSQLGTAKRYPVIVTVNGYTFRNTVGWYQGAYRIGFSAEHRAAAGVQGGDEVEAILELDDAPRILEVEPDFESGLGTSFEAFRALSYSKQRGLYEPWAKAKSPETRERNLSRIRDALG
jgi:hypothetical protein